MDLCCAGLTDKNIGVSVRYLHTMIRVKDLTASLNFWCDQLGLVEVKRSEHESGRFTLVFLAGAVDEARRVIRRHLC